mmetsp:Transcript_85951/g.172056  ORF Transcript_85951/g.172056 Transcript_85951/m.172056 type:complete len:284 (+) Transcript_85951:157-1008(+)
MARKYGRRTPFAFQAAHQKKRSNYFDEALQMRFGRPCSQGSWFSVPTEEAFFLATACRRLWLCAGSRGTRTSGCGPFSDPGVSWEGSREPCHESMAPPAWTSVAVTCLVTRVQPPPPGPLPPPPPPVGAAAVATEDRGDDLADDWSFSKKAGDWYFSKKATSASDTGRRASREFAIALREVSVAVGTAAGGCIDCCSWRSWEWGTPCCGVCSWGCSCGEVSVAAGLAIGGVGSRIGVAAAVATPLSAVTAVGDIVVAPGCAAVSGERSTELWLLLAWVVVRAV